MQDLDIAESIFAPNDSHKFDLIQNRYGGYWRYPHMLDFCYLVNPFFPPQKLLDEIKANFEILVSEYPSGQRVNSLLAAKFFGVSESKMATGNGAAELIKSLLMHIDGKLGVVMPTFEEYPNRKKENIAAFMPNNCDFSYSAVDLMDFFLDKPIDALVIINPDNPSGNYILFEGLLKLIEWAKSKGIYLVVDESFVDFASIDDTLLQESLLTENPHLIVIKSISKSYGVPGLRLGVLACGDTKLVASIRKDLSIWNINSFAEFYLQICEKYKSNFTDAMMCFYLARDEFYAELKCIPFLRPIPSKANYITCQLKDKGSARKLAELLLAEHNILIKDLSGKNGIEGEYVRLAVKTIEENRRLIEVLASINIKRHVAKGVLLRQQDLT